jgi:hypothetical protein
MPEDLRRQRPLAAIRLQPLEGIVDRTAGFVEAEEGDGAERLEEFSCPGPERPPLFQVAAVFEEPGVGGAEAEGAEHGAWEYTPRNQVLHIIRVGMGEEALGRGGIRGEAIGEGKGL